ncbi:MAG TPA: DUF1707 domain-containing protein [Solirubrobacteraceae bacterium]|nr:DUF1707 domain-containing protein [Solirubrobacteraceae bacterium]
MADPPKLRVSDEERERAATDIREHFAAGRLSDDELAERLQSVYSAKTSDELQAVRSDLPQLPATPAEQRAELAARRAHLQRRMLQQAGGGAGTFILCTAVWVATGASGQFWPIWVALVALIPLIRNGWRLYGPAPELERVQEDLARRERRDHERSERRADRHEDRRERRLERRDRRRLPPPH